MLQPDLLALLPAYFRAIKDFQALMETEGAELSAIEGCMGRVRDNFFIQTADLDTLAFHESLFRIVASPSEGVDFRRARVLASYNNMAPWTMRALVEKLNLLLGAGNFYVDVDYAGHILNLGIHGATKALAVEIAKILIRIVPAHMDLAIVSITTTPLRAAPVRIGGAIAGTIMETALPPMFRPATYGELRPYTYGQLATRTYGQLRQRIFPSINPEGCDTKNE